MLEIFGAALFVTDAFRTRKNIKDISDSWDTELSKVLIAVILE